MQTLRILRTIGLVALVLALGGAIVARQALTGSRPQAVGVLTLAGLGAAVTVERDAAGVVTLTAADRRDLARATGFVHAQERFFQMDLLRRSAAGELSELVGAAALDHDRARRLHRMRAVAVRTLALAEPADAALVEAYAAGVNAGLAALRVRPIEYLVLRQTPRPWSAVDTVLVSHAMWFDLSDESGARERELARMRAVLPAAVVELLMPRATPWDSPLRPTEAQPPLPPLPGAELVDLRRTAPTTAAIDPEADPATDPERARLLGSNNFAVGGALTADGRAILAGDMHLSHGVPNIWFRLRLRTPVLDATGVTLPGTPLLVSGSNGKVAWAFTNSYGDWTDLHRLEVDGDRYRVGEGWVPFEHATEMIAVAGDEPVALELRATRWGPVLEDAGGTWAIAWLAHRPEATNLELLRAERAGSVAELVALAPRIGISPQNMAMADAAGHVGWTVAGRIPQRAGWRDAADGWAPREPGSPDAPPGFLESADGIAVVDPADHRIWSANARVASGAALTAIGDGGYDLGARARQIRDGLFARERFGEADLLAVQLDDRARFLAPWRELLLAELSPSRADTPLRAAARDLVERWSGRAAPDDAGYRIVRGFRAEVRKRMVMAFEAPLRVADPEFFAVDGGFEGALWRIVNERPAHLLPAGAADWDAFLLEALDGSLAAAEPAALARATWGDANRARIRHPLSGSVPGFAALFDMPATPLPGDSHMPRVQSRGFGASQRMVVAPGHEADGYFHMPAGQSGHPLTPYYRVGHADWEQGRPTPFLPGPTRWTLKLAPGGGDDELVLTDLALPATSGALAPRLAAAPDGGLIASWLEPSAGGHALRFARLGPDGWDAPRDAARGGDWFVNWADTPGVFAAGDLLVAHWLRKSGASTYAYDVVLATSRDGGASWGAPSSPHHDGTATEHGFVSHFASGDGFGLVWLDGRRTGGGGHEGHAEDHGAAGGGMTLRSARFDAAGAQLDELEVDTLTCDCCPTDVASTATGPLLVYRDRTADEIRDVQIARLGAAGWSPPRPVQADGWRMAGCPVNGPAIDAAGGAVAVAWFTAAAERPSVQLAWSGDGGERFGPSTAIDEGAPVGRVEVVMGDDHALVFWLENTADGAALRVRRAWSDGRLGAPRTLAVTAAARSSGFPRATRAGGSIYLSWTEVASSGATQVRVARLDE